MLPVAIDADGVVKSHLKRFFKSISQSHALANVLRMRDERDLFFKLINDGGTCIRCAVIHDDELISIFENLFDQPADRFFVVVSGKNDAAFKLAEPLFIMLIFPRHLSLKTGV